MDIAAYAPDEQTLVFAPERRLVAMAFSLAPGGRLFAVVGPAPVMDAILVRRVDGGEWIRESLFETVIDPLINATAVQRFIF